MSNLLLARSAQMGRHPLLPKEYQQVEYIESTGTQWIDLGIRGNSECSYELTYQMTSKMNAAIFGCRNQSAYYAGPVFCYSYTGLPINGTWVTIGNRESSRDDQTNSIGGWANTNDLNKHIVFFSPTQGYVYLDNQWPNAFLNTSPTFQTKHSLYLFCNSIAGARSTPQKMRFFNLTICGKNGAITNRFIPCIRIVDRAVGIFDSQTRRFLENAGSGIFRYKNMG